MLPPTVVMSNRYLKIAFLPVLLLSIIPSSAQTTLSDVSQNTDSPFENVAYKIESAGTMSDGEHAPLWLNANRQGLSSIQKNNGYLAAGIYRPFTAGALAYSYGLELAGAYHFTSHFIVQQAYLDLRYRIFQLSIGSKGRNGELVNQKLSSGGLSYSGNARPIPQIRIGIPEYTVLPIFNHWLSIKGHVAYGRFTDDSWQKDFVGDKGDRTTNVLYHSKAMFLKISRPDKMPLSLELGLQMENQFGGTRHYSNGTKYKMPSGIKDYFKVFIPTHGGNDTPESDQLNIEGNTLGSYHFSLSYKKDNWEIRPYYEHYFEDQSMLSMKHKWKDGLIGIELSFPQNPIVSKVVIEYFGTTDQSGPPTKTDSSGKTYTSAYGADNYYNNGFYNSWSHWGMALGNPLFISPIYTGSLVFRNNRLTARHIGISGNPCKSLSYRLLYSYTRNLGKYYAPYKDTNNNTIIKTGKYGLFELTYSPNKLKGWSFTASAAADRGNMLGKNTGAMLTIRKTSLNFLR